MSNENLVSILEASKMLGVARTTLRVWDKKGIFTSVRTLGGHRRYCLEDLKNLQKRTAISPPNVVEEKIIVETSNVFPNGQLQEVVSSEILSTDDCVL